MKKLKQILTVAILFILATNNTVHSQSIVTDAYVRMLPLTNGTQFDGVFTVEVSDTSTTSAIEVKLGTADGVADLANYTFNYDVTVGLPSGYYYSRSGNICTLGIGTITLTNSALFGEVRIHRTDGSWSSAYKFISN